MLFSIYDCVFSLDYDHPYSFSINIVNHSFLKRGLFLPINKAHVNKLNYYIYIPRTLYSKASFRFHKK
jgi:hypothetical protein